MFFIGACGPRPANQHRTSLSEHETLRNTKYGGSCDDMDLFRSPLYTQLSFLVGRSHVAHVNTIRPHHRKYNIHDNAINVLARD